MNLYKCINNYRAKELILKRIYFADKISYPDIGAYRIRIAGIGYFTYRFQVIKFKDYVEETRE